MTVRVATWLKAPGRRGVGRRGHLPHDPQALNSQPAQEFDPARFPWRCRNLIADGRL